MVIYNEDEEVSLIDLHDYQIVLESLNKQADLKDPEQDIEIWNALKQIAWDLDDPRVMKRPYAKQYYPILITLILRIRKKLQADMENSAEKPESWKLFCVE